LVNNLSDVEKHFLNADLRKSNADIRRFCYRNNLRESACPAQSSSLSVRDPAFDLIGGRDNLRESALKDNFLTKVNLTAFQCRVFKAVLQIPLGEVRSYKWVAKEIGRPKSTRAVASALRANPFPLIIPCHRVVYSDGRAGGYRWGVKRKLQLLKLERKMRKNQMRT